MTTANRLGPLVTIGNIRDACLVLAGRDGGGYLPDYLRDACIAEGKAGDWVAPPRSWEMAANVTKWPAQQLPAVFVTVPGTVGTPRKRGAGLYAATWEVGWVAIVAGKDNADTSAQSSIYEAAMRSMFAQQAGGLAGLTVESFTWTGSEEDRIPQSQDHDVRYLRAVSAAFTLEIADVATARQGITEPSAPPVGDPGAYPTADTVTVDLDKIPEE